MSITETAFENPVVAIAQKGNFNDGNPEFAKRHQPLLEELGERGVTAVVLNGAQDRTGNGDFSRYFTPTAGQLTAHDETLVVDAAYDLTGGVGRFVPEVAALNPRPLRDLVSHKGEYARLLRQDLGEVVPQTIAVPAVLGEVEAGVEAIEGDVVVVKADKDPGKKQPILIGTKDAIRRELPAFVEAAPSDKLVLIQGYLPEVDSGFHAELQPDGSLEADLLKQEGRRELRAHLIDETLIAVMGRVGLKEGTRGKWVHFRPDTIPSSVTETATAMAKSLRQEAGAVDSHLAIDLTPNGERLIEANGRNIGTMRPDPERPAAQRVHEAVTDALADKLTDMAIRKRKGAL